MTIIETSIKIGRPVEQVFEFLSNFVNQKKLNNMLTEVIVSGPIRVGTRIKYKTGRHPASCGRITRSFIY